MSPEERQARDDIAQALTTLALQLAGTLPIESLVAQMESAANALCELAKTAEMTK
jgi:hypothetical protein